MHRALLLLLLAVVACGDDGGRTNSAPTGGNVSLTTAEDQPVTRTVEATDVDGDTLAATVAIPASHGTATATGLALTYTPEADYHGADQFALVISDGSAEVSVTVDVVVSPVNDAAVGGSDAIQTSEDTARIVPVDQLLSNDSDVDGDPLAITAVAPGAHGTVALANGNVTYLPEANFSGGDSFTYTINDGTVDTTVTVAVVIGGVNDVPVAVDDQVTTAEDTAITIQGTTLLANDGDADGDVLSISAVSAATGGTVVLNGGNPIFTPAANSTTAGSFVYTVTDGVSADTATVTVNITAANDGPVAVDDTATTNEDTVVVIGVLGNDGDPDGTTPTLAGVSNAQGGTPVANGNGTVSFTPNANFHGTATFDYSITDGTLTDTATVTVTVNAVNDLPVAVDDSGSTDVATPVTFTTLTANDTDVDIATDGQTLTVTAVANAVNGTVVLSGGQVTFTPTSTQPGSFDYTVSDGNGGTDTGKVTISINVANVVPPTATADTVSQIDAATSYPLATFLANDSDGGDGGALVITAVSGALNGTVSLDATTITFTPTVGFSGTAGFQYTLSDGNVVTATGTVTVDVSDCGNGQITGVETCDDGRNDAGDGCSARCTVEPGFTCNNQTPPSVCTPVALASFSFTGAVGSETSFNADVVNGLTAIPAMTRGAGVAGEAAANTFNSTGWSTTSPAVIDLNDFYAFTITPNAGGTISLTQLRFAERRSGTGIRQIEIRSSLDNFAAAIFTASVPDDAAFRTQTVPLAASFLASSAPISFRIYGFGAEAAAGSWRIDDVVIQGSATP